MTRYTSHVLHSASLYPLGTFWLASMIVIPLTMIDVLEHGHAAVILTIMAALLVLIADRRDTNALRHEVDHVANVVDCQREGLETRIQILTDALLAAGLPIPPTGERHAN